MSNACIQNSGHEAKINPHIYDSCNAKKSSSVKPQNHINNHSHQTRWESKILEVKFKMPLHILKVLWMIKFCNSLIETTSQSCSVHQKLCSGARSEAVFHTRLRDSSQLHQARWSFLFCFLIHAFGASCITTCDIRSAGEKILYWSRFQLQSGTLSSGPNITALVQLPRKGRYKCFSIFLWSWPFLGK